MSYCRMSTPNSDVYVVRNEAEDVYECYVAWDIDSKYAGKTFKDEDIKKFRDVLIWLSCQGVRVPKRALIRLDYEIKDDWDGWINWIHKQEETNEDYY